MSLAPGDFPCLGLVSNNQQDPMYAAFISDPDGLDYDLKFYGESGCEGNLIGQWEGSSDGCFALNGTAFMSMRITP